MPFYGKAPAARGQINVAIGEEWEWRGTGLPIEWAERTNDSRGKRGEREQWAGIESGIDEVFMKETLQDFFIVVPLRDAQTPAPFCPVSPGRRGALGASPCTRGTARAVAPPPWHGTACCPLLEAARTCALTPTGTNTLTITTTTIRDCPTAWS
ncbi:hypothetical protein C0Q70_01807 [Pomacea canaliculata]|uniref:Uncharacterized protein n=1 Tax=Pomacea canaliculata TaxID=400727 RepID=A0A2T7Q0I8_POMCA|nr:hypothetical protein C0Q70_01807 [Pomacea canaliculata]